MGRCAQAVCAQPADDATTQEMRNCLRTEGAARQQCIDRLWWELTGDEKTPVVTRGGGRWIISETTSPVHYTPQISAAVISQAAAENAPTSLTIHCRRQRAELSVSTAGMWKASSADEFRVSYRVNEGPVIEERWASAAGGRTALFKGDALQWLQKLPEGGLISFRVFDWQGPAHEAISRWRASRPRANGSARHRLQTTTGNGSRFGATARTLRLLLVR